MAQRCDRIPQCPNGSDESWELCKDTFPPAATQICNKWGLGNNFTIQIKATRCNGVRECVNGEDESNCGDDRSLLVTCLIFGGGFALFLFVSCGVNKCTIRNPHVEKMESLTESFEDESKATIVETVTVAQNSPQKSLMNRIVYQLFAKKHQGQVPDILNSLKSAFDPNTYQNIVDDNGPISRLGKVWNSLKEHFDR